MRHTTGPYQALPEEPPPPSAFTGENGRPPARPSPTLDGKKKEMRTETKGCDTPGSRMGETCGKASDA